jgi:predicted Na+-dependent transporter
MVGGWLVAIISTLFHPSGSEDDHVVVFAQYAESGSWVAVHLAQFVGVLLALSGLVVLYRCMRAAGRQSLVAHLAFGATVATAAVWAVLQGLDGVALKQAVEAWASASGAEKEIRFANAENVRWLEWGFQSYFRLLLGLTFLLFGAAIVTSRLIAGWLGWAAVLAGVISLLIGVDVGYSGLASALQDLLGIPFLVVGLGFAVGVLATGLREGGRRTTPT